MTDRLCARCDTPATYVWVNVVMNRQLAMCFGHATQAVAEDGGMRRKANR